jgi:hypothetical protein
MNGVQYAMWVVYAYTIWVVAECVWHWWNEAQRRKTAEKVGEAEAQGSEFKVQKSEVGGRQLTRI